MNFGKFLGAPYLQNTFRCLLLGDAVVLVTSSFYIYIIFFELEIHTIDVNNIFISLIFYPLTALLDLFHAKSVVKTISNKRTPYDDSEWPFEREERL